MGSGTAMPESSERRNDMRYCLALDVAKGKSMAVLASDAGEILLGPKNVVHSLYELESLAKDAEKISGTKPTIMMEATSVYHLQPKIFFEERGYQVVVTNPLVTATRKKTLRKTKTDREDSIFLATSFFSGDFSIQEGDGSPNPDLQGLLRQESLLTKTVAPLKCKMRMLVTMCFPSLEEIFPGNSLFSPTVLRFIAKCPSPELIGKKSAKTIAMWFSGGRKRYGLCIREAQKVSVKKDCLMPAVGKDSLYCASLSRMAEFIGEIAARIAVCKAELASECKGLPMFSVCKSFDGISDFLAATLAAEIGNPTRFSNEKKLIAYCGLDPTIVQSGKSINWNGPISKRGNAYARTALFQCVIMMLRRDGIASDGDKTEIGNYYRKKRSDGKHHYAAVMACATKLLRQIYFRSLDFAKTGSLIVK
jgi:transposase